MNLERSRKVKLLQEAFGPGDLESSEKNIHLCCPSCNESRKEKKKLCVLLESGWYNCWVCNFSGKNITSLFYKYAPKYVSQCAEIFGVEKKRKQVNEEEQQMLVELPDDIKLVIENLHDPDTRDIARYLKSRGMTALDMYRWRVCSSSRFDLRRKAIFPSFDSTGKLNYYVARAIDETKFKYNNAKVPKSKVIFNELDLVWTEPVILVEGVFDAVKCPDNTAVALGSTLPKSSELFKKLHANKSTVIVAFDADAEDKSHAVCRTLSGAGCRVFKVSIAGDDLGSRSKEEAKKVLSTAKPWSTIEILSNKISKIRSGSIL